MKNIIRKIKTQIKSIFTYSYWVNKLIIFCSIYYLEDYLGNGVLLKILSLVSTMIFITFLEVYLEFLKKKAVLISESKPNKSKDSHINIKLFDEEYNLSAEEKSDLQLLTREFYFQNE